MKFNIFNYNQQKACEMGLDLKDLLILDWFQTFQPRMHKTIRNDKQYYWIKYDDLIADIPIIEITTASGLYKRLKNLTEIGILEHMPIKTARGGFSYYLITEKICTLTQQSHSPEKATLNPEKATLNPEKASAIYNSSTIHSSTINAKDVVKQKPSLSEIQEFITQEKLPINANDGFSYYEKNNWVKKNGKEVVNWKSTVKNRCRPTIAEKKASIENISFEIQQKEKIHTPYEKLHRILRKNGMSRSENEIKSILALDECKEWIEQVQSNKTFEATLADIQNNLQAQDVLKNGYISFLEKFKTSKEQIENDIKEKLPLFLIRCEKFRYVAVMEGLDTIQKSDYNEYMKKQSNDKLPFITHFDYIIERIKFIDGDIANLIEKLDKLLDI